MSTRDLPWWLTVSGWLLRAKRALGIRSPSAMVAIEEDDGATGWERVSDDVLARVWDNPIDAEYDLL